MAEKRKYARATLRAVACIYKDDEIIVGEVKDLSVSGTFVSTAMQMEVNEVVTVTIYHRLTPQALHDVKARVARVTEYGMGLQFEKNLMD